MSPPLLHYKSTLKLELNLSKILFLTVPKLSLLFDQNNNVIHIGPIELFYLILLTLKESRHFSLDVLLDNTLLLSVFWLNRLLDVRDCVL